MFNYLLKKAVTPAPLTWRKWSDIRKCSHLLFQTLTRTYSDSGAVPGVICQLKSRGLVKVKGADTIPFLQGLVTNDVTLLQQQKSSLYTMLLNVQGRVQYDLILYNVTVPEGEPTLLVECDQTLLEQLVKDIRKYKIRKKVSIEPVEELSVYARQGQSTDQPVSEADVIIQTEDPRVPQFASRLIVNGALDNEEETLYHTERLKWGIPEGYIDLPFGNCLPLECNLVYMNGVSFSKGCYLGQELTARTHHTGVIRKRLMPLIFADPPEEIEQGENILNEKGKSVGKFRSSIGKYGLGLLRTAEVKGELSVKTKTGESVRLEVKQPEWWPKE